MSRFAYSPDASTEKPHCGSTPSTEPITGPKRDDLVNKPIVFLPALCSKYSMRKNIKSRNGSIFIESINDSNNISKKSFKLNSSNEFYKIITREVQFASSE